QRIADMNEAGIDVQVLSLTSPGVQNSPPDEARRVATDANDRVADAIRKYPTRFAGFATLPTPDPKAAADELERCLGDLHFAGAMINGHTNGRYLDDASFDPIFERAEALEAPIYLHPTLPPDPIRETYYSGFSEQVNFIFSAAGWGWHIETATHVLRMILGGVFDRHPKLQMIVGHLGEALPFMLPRFAAFDQKYTKLERPVSAYLRENFNYTFSGFNFLPSFLPLLLQVGVERICFSTDWPYAEMKAARAFLESLPLAPADCERVAHGNAERLLRL
ncbi:MAG TPA: amidohydrolase family protein, partial [Candidatus Tumulicola sp.]